MCLEQKIAIWATCARIFCPVQLSLKRATTTTTTTTTTATTYSRHFFMTASHEIKKPSQHKMIQEFVKLNEILYICITQPLLIHGSLLLLQNSLATPKVLFSSWYFTT
jgi:hypothetical protein